MVIMGVMIEVSITEAKFLETYGHVRVGEPPKDMSLEQALLLEELLCPAPKSERQDSAKRLGYLAKMVGNSLLDEHKFLLPVEEQ